jgi:hypothetical protein
MKTISATSAMAASGFSVSKLHGHANDRNGRDSGLPQCSNYGVRPSLGATFTATRNTTLTARPHGVDVHWNLTQVLHPRMTHLGEAKCIRIVGSLFELAQANPRRSDQTQRHGRR